MWLDESVEIGKDFMLMARVLRKEPATSRDKEGAAYQFRRYAFRSLLEAQRGRARQRGYIEQLRDRLTLRMKEYVGGRCLRVGAATEFWQAWRDHCTPAVERARISHLI